ncbi:GNAT family N-acetyltransferase [Sporosarcina sp. NPDC096371]|uniref:GNAT family N-acetyltransferase n=1 Tax=Sporosarcina sp. NPDC096371 TaxID=3364530 RepID=UPI00381470FA
MIRILTEEDRTSTLDFVSEKPAENLFIIGDIEAYGFDNPIQKLWGDFTDNGELRGVLLKYAGNFIVYAPREYDAKGFAETINQDEQYEFISGIEHIVQKLEPYLAVKASNPRVLYYAKCESIADLQQVSAQIEVEKAKPDDAERIIDQMVSIPEFSMSTFNVEHKRDTLGNGSARTYFIEEEGRIISSASSTAENSQSAMIVGVGTLPGFEKQGLASMCMSILCAELLSEGKMLCLFYDNPAAGSIYKRLGFVDIGKWCMWRFDK